eukprot:125810-Prymnesium_polylepis.1
MRSNRAAVTNRMIHTAYFHAVRTASKYGGIFSVRGGRRDGESHTGGLASMHPTHVTASSSSTAWERPLGGNIHTYIQRRRRQRRQALTGFAREDARRQQRVRAVADPPSS